MTDTREKHETMYKGWLLKKAMGCIREWSLSPSTDFDELRRSISQLLNKAYEAGRKAP